MLAAHEPRYSGNSGRCPYAQQRGEGDYHDSVCRHGANQAFDVNVSIAFFIESNQVLVRPLKTFASLIAGCKG